MQLLVIFSIHKPSLGSCEVPTKFGPHRFSHFNTYWIQTDKHTDKESIYIESTQVMNCVTCKSYKI